MSRKRRFSKARHSHRGHRGQLPPAKLGEGNFNPADLHVERSNLSIAPGDSPRVAADPALKDHTSPPPGATAGLPSSASPSIDKPTPAAVPPPPLNRRQPKMDAAAKARICDLVSVGKTIAQAARIVGVSERAVFYAKQRDPNFEQQLHESYEDPTLVCAKTLKQFAHDDPKIAKEYWKILEPDRFDPRVQARAEKLNKKSMGEVRRALSAILTPDQLAQFDQLINPTQSQRKRHNQP